VIRCGRGHDGAVLGLPRGALLRLGRQAVVEVTGLRNPCNQINRFRPRLLREVVYANDQGNLIRKAGIMGIVLHGGPVRPGDQITVVLPAQPHLPLDRV
jgi:MOSC domain-containing protein YiiM